MDYKTSGVDIKAGREFVSEIKEAVLKGKIISEYFISKNIIKSVIINLQNNILILGHKFNIKFNKEIKMLEV